MPRKTDRLTLDRVMLLQDIKLDRNVRLQSTRHGAVIWALWKCVCIANHFIA